MPAHSSFLGAFDQGFDLLLQLRGIARGRGRLVGEESRQAGVGALGDRRGAGHAGMDVAGPVVDQPLLDQRALRDGFHRAVDFGQPQQADHAHDDDHGEQDGESAGQAGSHFRFFIASSVFRRRRAAGRQENPPQDKKSVYR